MPGRSNPYCPMKFNSKTISQDGYVKKDTCACDEALCGWWYSDAEQCVIMALAENVAGSQKLEKAKLRLLLAGGEDKQALEAMTKAYPFLEAQKDIRAALD